MEVSKQQEAVVSDIVIVPNLPAEYAAFLVESATDEGSPLRRVAPHAAKAAIEVGYALAGDDAMVPAIIFQAEGWLVEKYVGADFCGLCARSTNHQGEH